MDGARYHACQAVLTSACQQHERSACLNTRTGFARQYDYKSVISILSLSGSAMCFCPLRLQMRATGYAAGSPHLLPKVRLPPDKTGKIDRDQFAVQRMIKYELMNIWGVLQYASNVHSCSARRRHRDGSRGRTACSGTGPPPARSRRSRRSDSTPRLRPRIGIGDFHGASRSRGAYAPVAKRTFSSPGRAEDVGTAT